MRVIAIRQSQGDYGTLVPDQEVELQDETATQLLAMGVVRHARPPKVEYETKILTPQQATEVSARTPFRDGAVPNAESADMASRSHKIISSADLLDPRAADSGGRGRRSGSDSGR